MTITSLNECRIKLTQKEMIDKKIELDELEEKAHKIRIRIHQIRGELKDGFKRKRH